MLKLNVGLCTALLLFSLGLNGCTTLSNAPSGQPLSASQVSLLKNYQWDGRFAYQDRADNSGISASLTWLTTANQTHINVLGPLGLWRATFTAKPGDALLALSDGRQFRAPTIDQLMQQNLPWYLPVDALHYWLFSLPEPHTKAVLKKSATGDVASITQAGWTITYPSYQVINGYRLPQRIELTKGSLRLKLVIQRWTIALANKETRLI